ncbi:MAG: exodeoxyribonuclease V subunit alpha [Gammaproteobacteria bacterium]
MNTVSVRAVDPKWLEPLRAERQAGTLRDVDVHLARHLLALADGPLTANVALAIARLSRAQGDGDICLDLSTQAIWRAELLASGLASLAPAGDSPAGAMKITPAISPAPFSGSSSGVSRTITPLVIDAGHRLYLRKYFVFEQQVANDLLARAVDAPLADAATLAHALDGQFGGSGSDARQRAAADTALQRRLAVITGGPGTGKTTTVTRILAAMLSLPTENGGPLRIRLAAPTGKAAARLGESIRAAKAKLLAAGGDADAVARIPEDAQTLHRLLGTRPDTRKPRHGADNPLPLDVLVIDEASMIDLPLMARTLAALPPAARLVLLGDSHQLASVEAGAVLGDICHGIGADGSRSPLKRSLAQLLTSHRFRDDSGIGALARAINAGDSDGAMAIAASDPAIALHGTSANAGGDTLAAAAIDAWQPALMAPDVITAARGFDRFRVLCALRDGPRGVSAINARIEQALADAGLIAADQQRGTFYRGRPLLVTENDYGISLFNGDIGLVWPDDDGVLRACFVAADGSVRRLPLARLPAHETCYAMTVHKSQGSEFDRVALVLPDADSPVLGRELVYTGITRAKTSVAIWSPREVLATAIGRRVERSSGLRDALWGA